MLPISRASVVRELDRRLIEEVGLPSAVLMDHAAHLVADELLRYSGPRPTLILCGPGNNGGDGYALARHLRVRGVSVRAVPVLPPRSPECQLHASVAQHLGLVGPAEGFAAAQVVDALYGTGQRAPLVLPEIPGWNRTLPLIALDVPTGMDADTGVWLAEAPVPDFVITIGRLKPFLFAHAIPYALCDIGLELRADGEPEARLGEVLAPPPFASTDNKWSRGHVGILAGTPEKAGAAVLCCLGALRGGAGLVTLALPREGWGRLASLPPEVMLVEPEELERLAVDALVVGPGLGRREDARIHRLWAAESRPVVVDADGLRALDGTPSAFPRLITPHAGEAGALLKSRWEDLEKDRFSTAHRLSAIAPAIYKGVHPIVAAPQMPLTVFWGACPQLGVGGSGDVLAGLCGALSARFRPRDAPGMALVARQAVSLQLLAAQRLGNRGVLASEIAEAMGRG